MVHARLVVDDLRDVAVAVRRCRDLLDLDADPAQVDAVLAGDPALAPLVAARPGLRVPGAVDGFEIAVRAVLGQQISVAAARTMTARLVQRFSAVELAAEAALVPESAGPGQVARSAGQATTATAPRPVRLATPGKSLCRQEGGPRLPSPAPRPWPTATTKASA